MHTIKTRDTRLNTTNASKLSNLKLNWIIFGVSLLQTKYRKCHNNPIISILQGKSENFQKKQTLNHIWILINLRYQVL